MLSIYRLPSDLGELRPKATMHHLRGSLPLYGYDQAASLKGEALPSSNYDSPYSLLQSSPELKRVGDRTNCWSFDA